MLDESTLREQLRELFPCDEVVLLAILLARTRSARGVCQGDESVRRTAPRQGVAVLSRETLKPNLSGYSVKRRVRRVLLPTPDGPEITRGRTMSIMGDIVRGQGSQDECAKTK